MWRSVPASIDFDWLAELSLITFTNENFQTLKLSDLKTFTNKNFHILKLSDLKMSDLNISDLKTFRLTWKVGAGNGGGIDPWMRSIGTWGEWMITLMMKMMEMVKVITLMMMLFSTDQHHNCDNDDEDNDEGTCCSTWAWPAPLCSTPPPAQNSQQVAAAAHHDDRDDDDDGDVNHDDDGQRLLKLFLKIQLNFSTELAQSSLSMKCIKWKVCTAGEKFLLVKKKVETRPKMQMPQWTKHPPGSNPLNNVRFRNI